MAFAAASLRRVGLKAGRIGRPIALRQLWTHEATPVPAKEQYACHPSEDVDKLPDVRGLLS
jgi:hypothetical protein